MSRLVSAAILGLALLAGATADAGPVERIVNGAVVSASGGNLVVRTHAADQQQGIEVTVVTSGATRYLRSNGSTATVGDVGPCARIHARGNSNPDGSVTAAQVLIK